MAISRRFLALAVPATLASGFLGYGVYRAARPQYIVRRGVYSNESECKQNVPAEYHSQCEPVANVRDTSHTHYGRWYGPAYYGKSSPWSGTSGTDEVGTTSKKLADGTPISSGSYTKGSKSGGSKATKSGFGHTGKSTSGGKTG